MELLWQSLRVRLNEDAITLRAVIDGKDRLDIALSRGGPSSLPQRTRRLDLQLPTRYHVAAVESLIAALPRLETLVFSNGTPQSGPPRYIPQGIINAVSTLCPRLKKLQFRSIVEQPTVTDLSRIASGCREIRTLQIASIEPQCLSRIPLFKVQDDTPLFESLHTLSLGSGADHFPPYSEVQVQTYPHGHDRIRFADFLRMLGVHMDDFPALRDVQLLGEVVSDTELTFVDKRREVIQVVLCSSSWRCWIAAERWATFINLRWLIIVVQERFDEVPKGLNVLEGVEVVQQGQDMAQEEMELVTQCMLTGVLRAGYKSLRKVVLRSTPIYREQQDWVLQYEWLFQEEGVVFVLETTEPRPLDAIQSIRLH